MKFVYRLIQFILIISIVLPIPLGIEDITHGRITTLTTILFFIGIIVFLEVIIKLKHTNKKETDSQTSKEKETYLSPHLEIPYSISIKKSNLIGGVILQSIFVFFMYQSYLYEDIKTFIIFLLAIVLLFKYLHLGDISFWNKFTFAITNNGIEHYKYGIMPWSNVRDITIIDIKHRGMNAGKRIVIKLNKSYLTNRSLLRKKLEGVLFKDSRTIIISSYLSNIPLDLLYASLSSLQKTHVGESISSILSDSSSIKSPEQIQRIYEYQKYEHEDEILISLHQRSSEIHAEIDYLTNKSDEYEKDKDSYSMDSRLARSAVKINQLLEEQLNLMEAIKNRTSHIKKEKSKRNIILSSLALSIFVAIYILVKIG